MKKKMINTFLYENKTLVFLLYNDQQDNKITLIYIEFMKVSRMEIS